MRIVLFALFAFASNVSAQKLANFEIDLPGQPFGVAVSQDQRWIFVSLHDGERGGIAVLGNKGGRITIARTVLMARRPSGIVLTHDGDMLIAAAGDFVVFFDTHRMETGESAAAFQWVTDGPKAGSVYVNVTADDKTLFVSDESIATITVMDLDRIRSLGRDSAANLKRVNSQAGAMDAIIGRIPVGDSPVALTFSKDQRWLFTTSEVAPPAWGWPRVLEREGGKPGQERVPEGAVVVVDVAKARAVPRESVVGRVPAGGSPVRLALSPDGSNLFVTARNSNAVLVFDTTELVTNPGTARPTRVRVGMNPVPIVLLKDGKLALVGNSNRYSANAAKTSNLTVLDTSRIGTQGSPIIGEIPCGAFPREFHLTTDERTLFLTNYRSRTIQVMDVSRVMEILRR